MSTMRRAYYIWDRNNLRHTSGSALIALIAAILIFSVLAAALLPMVSSSGEQAVLSNLGDKAYLLAEAGYRYVKSNYDRALTEADKIDNLDALDSDHDGNFTLSDGQSRFNLSIFSYFLSIPAGTYLSGNPISANPPGSLPITSVAPDDNVTITNQQLLSIDGTIYTITPLNIPDSVEEADDNVTFSLGQDIELSSRTNAYPAARTNQSSLVPGQNLTYGNGQGAMFPLRNGRINVQNYPNPLLYRYNNRASNTFVEVRDPADSTVTNISLPANALIVLNQSIRVRSTGIVGGGELETRRQVDYSISGESEEREEVPVALNDFQATDDNATATDIGGNQALAITEASNDASLLQLDSTVSAAPLKKASRRGGAYLSYDAQVKVGFHNLLGALPAESFATAPIPDTVSPVAAGLSFRLNSGTNAITSDTSYNGYGLSFIRADNAALPAPEPTPIFSNIVPSGFNDQPLIVLWQQTGNGTSREWLAYKQLQRIIYEEDFSDGTSLSTWTLAPNNDPLNLWRRVTTGGYPAGTPALNFGDPEGSAAGEQGAIISPPIVLCNDTPKITLAFWSKDETFLVLPGERYFQIIGSEQTITKNILRHSNWTLISEDISAFAGQEIQIRFYRTNSRGPYEGWYIDDIQVLCQWPVQDSTLMVRLREAAVVSFSSGTREIRQGDWVYGAESGTRGRVIQPPIVTSGDWTATTPATGTLLLNNVSSSGFDADGEDLWVVGRTGGISAHANAFDNDTDRKVNIIKAFYARATGIDAGNTDALDATAHTYPRREGTAPFRWPPDEDENWTADKDYFRLVQWDGINSLSGLAYVEGSDGTVIRSYDPDLQSPLLNEAISTELGLHAYGAGADNVYFDDFGLRLFFGTSSLFDTVLQH